MGCNTAVATKPIGGMCDECGHSLLMHSLVPGKPIECAVCAMILQVAAIKYRPVERDMPLSVKGRCPLGCGETLYLSRDGSILCSAPGCANPSTVAEVLNAPGVDRHTVKVYEDSERWSIAHPLDERLQPHGLVDCWLNDWMGETMPEIAPGVYTAFISETDPDRWTLTPVED